MRTSTTTPEWHQAPLVLDRGYKGSAVRAWDWSNCGSRHDQPAGSVAIMTDAPATAGTYDLAGYQVHRIGFGAMQLPGPGVMGPPKDHDAAIAVLRRAVELGVNHIDTAQFYGPDVSNALIREALHPYAEDLAIVSKVGARRDKKGELAPRADAGPAARGRRDQPPRARHRAPRRREPAPAGAPGPRAGARTRTCSPRW